MVDMSQFIVAKSDQLNADDLMDAPRTITISKVTAQPDAAEQPVSIHYEGGEGRPWKPCKTMRRILVGVWGKDASKYAGRSLTLYRDPTVAFGGLQVGGIRISHMSHIDSEKTVALMVTRGRKAPFKILPLQTEPGRTPAATSGDDPAAKWTSAYVAKLAGFTDLASLQAFEAEKAGKLAELKGARPELHAEVETALAARKAELTPADSFTDDLTGDAPASQTPELRTVLRSIEDAKTLDEVDSIDKASEAHRPFLGDADIARLDETLALRRNELRTAESAVAE